MNKHDQIVIIMYLASHLGVDSEWLTTKQIFLLNRTPEEIVDEGEGRLLIEWLETRLGIKPGQAF